MNFQKWELFSGSPGRCLSSVLSATYPGVLLSSSNFFEGRITVPNRHARFIRAKDYSGFRTDLS